MLLRKYRSESLKTNFEDYIYIYAKLAIDLYEFSNIMVLVGVRQLSIIHVLEVTLVLGV